nr:hypothetical protein [uncultured Bdellovibrio sp.]
MRCLIFLIIFAFITKRVLAEETHHEMGMMEQSHMSSLFCASPNESLDLLTGMCLVAPTGEKEFGSLMTHGNLFLVGISQEGPRGEDKFAAPNMLMFDYQKNNKSSHTFGINLMLTFEKWTFPKEGYPELFQIGEKNSDGEPYIDAQHPHSSPVMGLTLSDTYRWDDNSKDRLKIFFSPRGQTTEGPIAFMHRNTGMVNPDAPLGHHVGQDVGHISSTVLGAELYKEKTSLEVSAFHGTEPEPDVVELKLGALDSGAARIGYQLSEKMLGLVSFAYVHQPEPDEEQIKFYRRYSVSLYNEWQVTDYWKGYNTFIYGRVENYDLIPDLTSFLEEFAFFRKPMTIWGRIEVLQRTPGQLAVSADDLAHPEWITEATLGYSHHLVSFANMDFQAGVSVSKYFISNTLTEAYGNDPWAGKIFLQISGMKMHPEK